MVNSGGSKPCPVPGKTILDLMPIKDGHWFDSSILSNEKEVIAAIAKDRYCVVDGKKVVITEQTIPGDILKIKERK